MVRVAGPWLFIALLALQLSPGRTALAQQGTLELSFVPTRGVQMAAWVERADGSFVATLALTYGTATAGIGNRPGALQMNSGYRWPYGRREGVLPVWSHRRAAAPNARQFRRVIFQNRYSEGAASRSSDDYSVDDYYCLSFDQAKSSKAALDAVTCASVFASDKGRFIAADDVAKSYAEPFVSAQGADTMRALSLHSLYPPRRDFKPCMGGTLDNGLDNCFDHPDTAEFARHALSVMPELDAISRATPEGDRRTNWRFAIPNDWKRNERYVLFVEANTEGDYNERYNGTKYPTPKDESEMIWDGFAQAWGYPYRGQPSVVYSIPFGIDSEATGETSTPAGYGSLQGEDGKLHALDGSITDDPARHPGSGADRLRAMSGPRLRARVTLSASCEAAEAPGACGKTCSSASDCGTLTCDTQRGVCVSSCGPDGAPSAVQDLKVTPHADRLHAHMWSQLTFRTPSRGRAVADYEVRVRSEGGEWTMAFTPDKAQELLPVALDLCSDESAPAFNRCVAMPPGTEISVVLAGLKPEMRYEVSVTPRDAECGHAGAAATTSFETLERSFTTVSPCFVATATYGTPLAPKIGVLRRMRDRYLASHAPGRALISLYYQVGPHLSALVREHAALRRTTRSLLDAIVSAALALDR